MILHIERTGTLRAAEDVKRQNRATKNRALMIRKPFPWNWRQKEAKISGYFREYQIKEKVKRELEEVGNVKVETICDRDGFACLHFGTIGAPSVFLRERERERSEQRDGRPRVQIEATYGRVA